MQTAMNNASTPTLITYDTARLFQIQVLCGDIVQSQLRHT
jgi:hypothetical protein